MLKLYIYIKKQTNKSSIFWFFILVQTVWPKQYMKKQHQQNLVSHRAPCEYTDTEAKLVDTNTYCTPTGSCVWTFSHVSQWAPYDYTKKNRLISADPNLLRFPFLINTIICNPLMKHTNVLTNISLRYYSYTIWPVWCGSFPLLEPTQRYEPRI